MTEKEVRAFKELKRELGLATAKVHYDLNVHKNVVFLLEFATFNGATALISGRVLTVVTQMSDYDKSTNRWYVLSGRKYFVNGDFVYIENLPNKVVQKKVFRKGTKKMDKFPAITIITKRKKKINPFRGVVNV